MQNVPVTTRPVSRVAIGLMLRDAMRALRAAPGHALVVVLVLAAGVTLGTITFSVVDAVVLKPLPVERPERLVTIPTRDETRALRITPEVFWRLHDHLSSVETVAARSRLTGGMVTVNGLTEEWSVMHATAGIFLMLRLSASMGRLWDA